MFKIIVFCSHQDHFLKQKKHLLSHGFLEEQITQGDSNLVTREDCINNNLNHWLLFLDHDCYVMSGAKKIIAELVAQPDLNPVVFAGKYIDPQKASALQRAHNVIANTWLLQSHLQSQTPVILGGIFLMFAKSQVTSPEQKLWGGEDKLLAKKLIEKGYIIKFQENLSVIHDTNNSFGHFVKRAYLHGKNDAIFFNTQEKVRISYWIQKIDFSDLNSTLLILLHFCIQKAAKLFQKVHLMNKR